MASLTELIIAVRDAAEHQPDTMITLTRHLDDDKWLQLLSDRTNLSYPFDKPPQEQLAELEIPAADRAVVVTWESRLFADLETRSMTVDELSAFLKAYLGKAFGTSDLDDYSVTFEAAERGKLVADSDNEFLRKIVQLKRYFEAKSAN